MGRYLMGTPVTISIAVREKVILRQLSRSDVTPALTKTAGIVGAEG